MHSLAPRSRVLLSIAALIVALTLLAASFSSLEFETGRTILFTLESDEAVDETEDVADENSIDQRVDSPTINLLLNIVLYVIVPAGIVVTLATASGRAWLRRELAKNLTVIAFFYIVVRIIQRLELGKNSTDLTGVGTPLAIGSMPHTFVAAISFGISTVFILVGVLLFMRWWGHSTVANPVTASARDAIAEIEAGGELRSIILRCYHAMLESVRDSAGVTRLEHVTPREFEDHLIQIGLPSADVQQLTRLFERVRYGGEESADVSERKRAIHCLNTIVQAIEGNA